MKIAKSALDQLFVEAHTHNKFAGPVTDNDLREIYDLMKWGPTTANSQPARFIFVKSPEAKEKLRPALSLGNLDKTMAAPVTVIVAYDLEFYENLRRTFPHTDARSGFRQVRATHSRQRVSWRHAAGAYFLMAARALGFDCGPMSGFENAKVDAAFFDGTAWKSNFLIDLGHGDPAKVHPRNPRLSFDEACRIV